MLNLILENQIVILEALRGDRDNEWIKKEIDKQIDATSKVLEEVKQDLIKDKFKN